MEENHEKSNLWTEIYKPKQISEFVCNKLAINELYNWLKNFELNKRKYLKKKNIGKRNSTDKNIYNSCIIITGNHGIGKTASVTTILNELDYDTHEFNFDVAKNNKKYKKNIKKMMMMKDIVSVINNDKKKTAIIVDELEAITSTTDKNLLLTLQKTNDTEWHYPIIFISNNQHNKLLSDIKKSAKEIKFRLPNYNEIKTIMMEIIKKENINIKDINVVNKIIDHSQFDVRKMIFTLQDIKITYGSNKIMLEDIFEYCQLSKKKDIDTDLFHETKELFTNYKNINDCIRYYETDKTLLPLMVHENYIKVIADNNLDGIKKHEVIKDVSDQLSFGDVVENYIYGDQSWDMQEIHGFHTCAATSYYISKYMKTKDKRFNINFTVDLNKTSIKNINKKNIFNTNKCFDNMNIFDYIYMNKILRELISESKIEECVKLLSGYNIGLEHIESLLKIDKIKNTKTSLTGKQKKEFIKYLKEYK